MQLMKKVVSALLCASLLAAGLACAVPLQAQAAPEPQSSPSYENYTFTDDFEGDLSKWEAVGLMEGYENDFEIVTDPKNADNKALYFTQQGSLLMPKDAYWPADGQMLTATYRMRFVEEGFNYVGVPLSFRDAENFNTYVARNEYNGNSGFWAKYRGVFDGEGVIGGGAPNMQNLDIFNWFNVTVYYTNTSATVIFTDASENVFRMESARTVVDGKFAVGVVNWASSPYSNDLSTQNSYYIDDVTIAYSKLAVDKNIEQKDVTVYYAGNTVYDPGDLITITGEQLGSAVSGVSILKLKDSALSENAALASYINETDYELAVERNIDWADLQASAVEGTERTLPILQKSKLGIKVSIPDDGEYAARGMYAIRLTAAAEGGKDGIVIVNNPHISFLLHDDGEAATPNGWLRIAGSNLSIQNDKSKVSAIVIDGSGNRTFVDASQITVQTSADNADPTDTRSNDYYVEIALENMPVGNYQVILHNGHGGDLGWSMPQAFSVKEQPAYALWEGKSHINVKDYGAVGDSYHNDTAALIQALGAIDAAGGGTLYLPEGFYRVTDTIYLPENVTLKGDGKYKSAIFFDGNNWIDTPEAMMMFTDNIRITDLYFYGGVARALFKESEANTKGGGHTYFNNVRTMFDAAEHTSNGRVSDLMEGYTYQAAALWVEQQSITQGFSVLKTYGRDSNKYAAYLSITDTDFFQKPGIVNNDGQALMLIADYTYLQNTSWKEWSCVEPQTAGFVQNCSWTDGTFGYYGNTYFDHAYAGSVTKNNREVILTDGQPKYQNVAIQGINDDAVIAEILAEEKEKLSPGEYEKLESYIAQNKGRLFRTLTVTFQYDSDTASMLYVVKGQGAGQVRKINNSLLQSGGYTYFTVETDFAVVPNRNSITFIYGDRSSGFIVNSDFYNCGPVGSYGTYVDQVTDGIHMDEAMSGVVWSPSEGVNWYLTNRDCLATNIINGHTAYMEVKGAGFSYQSNARCDLSFFGIRVYGNTTTQGGHWGSIAGSLSNRKEVIFENNLILSDNGKGFRNFTGGGEGMYFRNNIQLDEEGTEGSRTTAYDDAMIALFRGSETNNFGSLMIICDEYSSVTVVIQTYGDVNNDGQVSLKDVSILRLYLSEGITQEQITQMYGKKAMDYADCDTYTGVDTRDIFEIYEYLLDPAGYRGRVGTTNGNGDSGPVEEYEIVHKNEDIDLDYTGVEEEGQDPSTFDLDYSNAPVQD